MVARRMTGEGREMHRRGVALMDCLVAVDRALDATREGVNCMVDLAKDAMGRAAEAMTTGLQGSASGG